MITTHVHKTIDRPPISSIDVGGYKSMNAENPKGKY
jgi:hypothetical protein